MATHPTLAPPRPPPTEVTPIVAFTVTITYCATGVTVVDLAGELDLATSPTLDFHLAHVLHERSCTQLILNVSHLSFCAAAGLSSLLRAQDAAQRRDIVLCLVSARLMDRLLALTGLGREFLTYPDLATARAAFTRPVTTVQQKEAS